MYTKCLNDLLPLKLTHHIILKQVLTSSLCSSSELPVREEMKIYIAPMENKKLLSRSISGLDFLFTSLNRCDYQIWFLSHFLPEPCQLHTKYQNC